MLTNNVDSSTPNSVDNYQYLHYDNLAIRVVLSFLKIMSTICDILMRHFTRPSTGRLRVQV